MGDITDNKETRNFIIPAIDMIDGKVVRLTQGDYAKQKLYANDPVEMAKRFEAAGLQRLHLVDLDGAKAGQIWNLKTLERIAVQTSLIIDFGGGIKTKEDVQSVLNAGAAIITIGSLAVKDPRLLEEWIAEYGTYQFLIGADVYDEKIKISGWLQDGGIDIFTFLQNMIAIGATSFFCTDIKKDGALEGSAVELYKKIIQRFSGIRLAASGGINSIADIEALKEAGCSAAIIGKAIYEGLLSLEELQTMDQ